MPTLSHQIPRALIPEVARYFVNGVATSSDSTQEIMLVENKDKWHRLFWNPVAQIWMFASHSSDGWNNTIRITTPEILGEIEKYLGSDKYLAMQYKNISGIKCYLGK